MEATTFYKTEITRIKNLCYSNEGQLHTVIGARNFIDRNYEQALNLEVLSAHRHTSKYHLLRLFKRYYGQTPGQYLIDKRLEASKSHLRLGCTVAEACYSVGFESPSSFSTLFKKKMGQSPKAYQKAQFSQSLPKMES